MGRRRIVLRVADVLVVEVDVDSAAKKSSLRLQRFVVIRELVSYARHRVDSLLQVGIDECDASELIQAIASGHRAIERICQQNVTKRKTSFAYTEVLPSKAWSVVSSTVFPGVPTAIHGPSPLSNEGLSMALTEVGGLLH